MNSTVTEFVFVYKTSLNSIFKNSLLLPYYFLNCFVLVCSFLKCFHNPYYPWLMVPVLCR